MKMLIEQKIQTGFAVAATLLILVGTSAWWSAKRNVETFRWVDHTYQVLEKFNDTLVGMLNTETENRGFAISGDETFLEPHQPGIAAVQKSFAAAKQLTQDNQEQQHRLAALEPLIQKESIFANEVIKARRSGDTAGALQLIGSGQEQQTMDEVRRLIAEMETAEKQLLQQRTDRAQSLVGITVAIVILGNLLIIGLIGLASVIVRRDSVKRRQTDAALLKAGALQNAIFNSANFSSIATDAKGVIQIFNVGAERMLGYAAADVMNKITPADISDPQEVIARAEALSIELETPITPGFEALMFKAAHGIEDIYELTYIRKDGSRFPAVVSVTALRDAHREIIGYLLIGTDNTARKRAEETLRLNEESLAVTLYSIGDAVLATDSEGRVTRMSAVAEKLTGWTQAEAQGRPIAEVFQIINEETRQPSVIPVDKVLATGEIHGLANHTLIIARDGTERPIADSAAPIRDKNGRILGVVLVFRDVAEEKMAEKAIRDSERQLLVINEELEQRVGKRTAEIRQALTTLDATEDGAFIFDPETLRHTYINEGAVRQLGYTREELLGMTAMGFEPEFTEVQYREMLAQMLRSEVRAHRFTTRHRHKDGHAIAVEINLQYVTPVGERPRFIAIARDITDRTREAETLRRMATVVRDSNDAITIQDFEGRITAWNRGAELMYGYSEAEALLANIERLTTPGKVAEQKEFIRRLIEGEAITSFETQRVTKDGRVLDVWMTVTKLMDDAGKPVGLASTERDITERLRNERLALRTQRLESIGTLAGGIAHDLNNALAPILMGVELLKTRYPGESNIVDMFEASARRGADMVRQLLTFAKGAEGERIFIQPLHLVREMESLMRGSFPKNIQLVVKGDPKLPLVLADATQLHQVLLNLCVNARDAMPHGGTLTLEAQQMEIDAVYARTIPDAKPGKFIMLRVRDTGTGIPREILDRIFDPFFTTKDLDKGTGLGLSTVMGIVKGHSGFLQVDSQPGQGSTFTVYLPANRPASDTEHITKAAGEFRGQGETILFVDDEPAVREVARLVLRHLNFKPLTATDGADGLIQAAQHRTDLRAIITDLHMPHMGGLELIRALRRILPDIPVMVASGRMEDAVAGEFKTLGVTSLLDKPFTEAQLAEALQKLLVPK